jgi:hypothetical protein
VVPPGFAPQVTPLPAPAVPPGFQPRAVSRTSATPCEAPDSTAAPRAVPTLDAAPHVAPTSSLAPCAVYEGPPPREWPASPMVYTRRANSFDGFGVGTDTNTVTSASALTASRQRGRDATRHAARKPSQDGHEG